MTGGAGCVSSSLCHPHDVENLLSDEPHTKVFRNTFLVATRFLESARILRGTPGPICACFVFNVLCVRALNCLACMHGSVPAVDRSVSSVARPAPPRPVLRGSVARGARALVSVAAAGHARGGAPRCRRAGRRRCALDVLIAHDALRELGLRLLEARARAAVDPVHLQRQGMIRVSSSIKDNKRCYHVCRHCSSDSKFLVFFLFCKVRFVNRSIGTNTTDTNDNSPRVDKPRERKRSADSSTYPDQHNDIEASQNGKQEGYDEHDDCCGLVIGQHAQSVYPPTTPCTETRKQNTQSATV